MEAHEVIAFPPFSLDPTTDQLWHYHQKVALRPKSLAVLLYLLRHPKRIITKQEFLNSLWPATKVGEAALKVCIREIRRALNDNTETPRFIETIPRKGYRFVAPLSTNPLPVPSSKFQVPSLEIQHSGLSTRPSVLVGREAELAQLHACLEKAQSGQRQIMFVTGEPGIGKTSLVETFLERQAANMPLTVARGQCVENYGTSEAYLPILASFDRLCRTADGATLLASLRRDAPTWLLQLTLPLEATDRANLQRQVQGTTPSRMLREIDTLLTSATVERPLLLVLEDLHWSDYATVTLLSYLAQQQTPAKLFIIATYRPVEVLANEHPLRSLHQELSAHGHCEEISLTGLSEHAIEEYLRLRFPHSALPTRLAHTLYQRTEGNPLFMVAMVEELAKHGLAVAEEDDLQPAAAAREGIGGVPDRLRQLITKQIEQLSAVDCRLLEAASVAGVEFSVVEVAAMLEADIVEVEERCEEFARQQRMLQPAGLREWPDGTLASRYRFHHAMYHSLWQERVKAGRWQRWHQRIGERKEAGYGERAHEIAAELALHFAQGRDYLRAVKYHQLAGHTALQRYGHYEAIDHFTQGITLLKKLPETLERDQQELHLQMTLGVPLVMTKGPTAPEAEIAYDRAYTLCQRLEATPQLVPVYLGLVRYYGTRGKLQIANELGNSLLTLAQQLQDTALFPTAYSTWSSVRLFLGDLTDARAQGEQAVEKYDAQKHELLIFSHGEDSRIMGLTVQLCALWHLGYPDQALQKCREAYRLALPHPFSVAHVQTFMAWLHQLRGEIQETQQWADALITLSTEQEVPFWSAPAFVMRGWALAEKGAWDEGIASMRQGLEYIQVLGAEIWWIVYQAMLGETYTKGMQFDEALRCMKEALTRAQRVGEFFYSAELSRIQGELIFQNFHVQGSKFQVTDHQASVLDAQDEAEACFHKAIEIARRQEAKSLELRATVSLARLWRQQGKSQEAHQRLKEVYDWFTEGFDTADLKEAKALLEELA